MWCSLPVERSMGCIAEVCKLKVRYVAQKRPLRPKEKHGTMCCEMTERSLVWILLTFITVLIGEDPFEEDLYDKPNPWYRKPGLQMEMMILNQLVSNEPRR